MVTSQGKLYGQPIEGYGTGLKSVVKRQGKQALPNNYHFSLQFYNCFIIAFGSVLSFSHGIFAEKIKSYARKEASRQRKLSSMGQISVRPRTDISIHSQSGAVLYTCTWLKMTFILFFKGSKMEGLKIEGELGSLMYPNCYSLSWHYFRQYGQILFPWEGEKSEEFSKFPAWCPPESLL